MVLVLVVFNTTYIIHKTNIKSIKNKKSDLRIPVIYIQINIAVYTIDIADTG